MSCDVPPSKKLHRMPHYSIGSVPDEILRHIFLGISLRDLYCRILRVCRRFRQIVMSSPEFAMALSTQLTREYPDSDFELTSNGMILARKVKSVVTCLYKSSNPLYDFVMNRLHEVYPEQARTVMSHTATIKFWMGGRDPIDFVYFYFGEDAQSRRFWHYVSVGMTQEYGNSRFSFPFEFSFRLYDENAGPSNPSAGLINLAPEWPVDLMQNFARYNFKHRRCFKDGDYIDAPIAKYQDRPTDFDTIAFRLDPILKSLKIYGFPEISFLEMICLTPDEAKAFKFAPNLALQILFGSAPVVTQLTRPCRLGGLEGGSRLSQILQEMQAQGTPCQILKYLANECKIETGIVSELRMLQIVISWRQFEEMALVLSSRIRFSRSFGLVAGLDPNSTSVQFLCLEGDGPAPRFILDRVERSPQPPNYVCHVNASMAAKLVVLSDEAKRLFMTKARETKAPRKILAGGPEELTRLEFKCQNLGSMLIVVVHSAPDL